MKKIIASAGLVAVSSTAMHAAAPGLSPMEASKPWSISATLRGFYDDNYAAAPSDTTADTDSFGFEVRPAAGLNFHAEQTSFGAAYVYSLRYYADRDTDSADHSHEFTLHADHRFSERLRLRLENSFVYAQEPALIDEDVATQFRTDADAFRNRAEVDLDIELTELIGLGLGYQNNWYDYDDEGNFSRSAYLDRMEHHFDLETRWRLLENLSALAGYRLGMFDYNSDEVIDFGPDGLLGGGDDFVGDDRDNISHHFFVGADQSLTSNLRATTRVGVQYTDYDKVEGDSLSPWVDVVGTYTYLPGSYVQFGFRHARNATDRADSTGDELVTDQETSSLLASINHRITPRLTGSLLGQYQRSTFSNGALEGDVDNFLLLGLNLEFRFSPNWATEFGYNFDRLDSDVPDRSFTRNRVYAGVRATY